jgi:DNA polymerase I-like protein with 3'-5' exonuclease and polymerase domains
VQSDSDTPKLLIITDAPSVASQTAQVCMPEKQKARLLEMLGDAAAEGVAFVTPCAPIPEAISENEKLIAQHLEEYASEFAAAVAMFPSARCVVTLGTKALRQAAGKAMKITTARGSFHTFDRTGTRPVMPIQSMANLFIRPQIAPIVESDLKQVITLAECGWEMQEATQASALDYQWSVDIEELVASQPRALVVDTETLGYKWFNQRAILTVQLCAEEGKAIIVPFNLEYWNNDALRGESSRHLPKLTSRTLLRLQRQVKELLENPNVAVCGHNLKFDAHHFRQYGIEIADWRHDTLQLAHTVDENMRQKNLDECTRRWVPALAGYADAFNADPVHVGKSRMDLVPHDKMIRYGCGDVDAGLRLAKVLIAEAKKDPRNYAVYTEVKMPAIKHVFFNHAERYGLPVDKAELKALGQSLTTRCASMEKELLEEAAQKWPGVLRRHADKGLKFSRADFVRDILFAQDGMFLESIVATKKTRKLAVDEQLESTSKKDHLPYFSHIPWVAKYMEYSTIATLIKSFMGRESSEQWVEVPRLKSGGYGKRIVEAFAASNIAIPEGPRRVRDSGFGDAVTAVTPSTVFSYRGTTYGIDKARVFELNEEAAKGFWWYLENIDPDALHPSFGLDVAVTGRSNCREPNLQNIPKRGEEAMAFRKIFKAPPGWVFVECDLSQAELRIAACQANETNMIKVYAEGGDIHAMTAQRVAGMTDAQWKAAGKPKQKELRQMAKAVNFGFLYGMWWRKFVSYAKTSYGVTVTDRQAERARETYFTLYPGLTKYHDNMRAFVAKHKYVRSLHGALRRLPDIDSVEEGTRKEAERQGINSPVQGFASDLGLMGATLFANGCDPDQMRVLGFIHDATVVLAREEVATDAAQWLRWCMQNQPLKEKFGLTLKVPVVADVSVGKSLAEMEEQPDIQPVRPPWVAV